MSNVFVGQIIQGGWNFAPRGFAECAGQLMSISQNAALFSLLGTQYGGNGTQTFGLPDLRGRTMVGMGQGPGLQDYVMGEMTGTENTTLTGNNLPSHTHAATFASTSSFSGTTAGGTQQGPSTPNSLLSRARDGSSVGSQPEFYAPAGTTPTTALGGLNVAGTVTVSPTGNNVPFSILQPLTVVNIVIAINGIFPSRN